MGVMDQILSEDTPQLPSDNELREIAILAEQQLDWERKIAQLEIDLAAAKEAHRQVSEFLLPEAMTGIGLSEFRMPSGFRLVVKDDIYASIRKDHTDKAIKWLDNNGLGGIVKDQITVKFGRGETDEAAALMSYCESEGFAAEEKLSVHPGTFKATVKEQMARGVQFPDELFSVGPLRKVEIKTK